MRALALIVLFALSACVTKPRLDGPPAASLSATPPGFSQPIRTLSMDRRFFESNADANTVRIAQSSTDGTIDILALSGGGAGGAYGAGILVGLSQSGERPTYELVTGVSTGALIAPLAFLGSDWDDELTAAYSTNASEGLMRSLGVGALFGVSAYRGEPLRDLVNRFVTNDLMAGVAREAATGRMLLVATTNLDREETTIWNLGSIAMQGGERARALFIDVLVASASVPGVFPPVMFEVRDGEQTFQEMHVDGGASTPFFVAPDIFLAVDYTPEPLRGAHVYVIANAQLAGPARTTPYNTISITSRSFSAVLNHMTRTALTQTGAFARRAGMDFQFTVIPRDYPYAGSLAFESEEMSALFEYGRRCAASGQIWVNPEQALARSEHAEARGDPATTSAEAPCPLLPQP